jgi:hypothetical protein
MVCSNTNIFNLAFSVKDFCNISQAEFDQQIKNAKDRALWIMTADCSQFSEAWGILQSDLDADVSGKLQVALELLTSSEFLGKYIGLGSIYKIIGSYTSPTGESINKSSQDIDKWTSLRDFLYQRAWEYAYNWVSDCAKNQSTIVVKNYDWHALEKDYFNNVLPAYNPKPYWNEDINNNV